MPRRSLFALGTLACLAASASALSCSQPGMEPGHVWPLASQTPTLQVAGWWGGDFFKIGYTPMDITLSGSVTTVSCVESGGTATFSFTSDMSANNQNSHNACTAVSYNGGAPQITCDGQTNTIPIPNANGQAFTLTGASTDGRCVTVYGLAPNQALVDAQDSRCDHSVTCATTQATTLTWCPQ